MEADTFPSSERLTKFREVLKLNNIDAYIIPHNDAHDVLFSSNFFNKNIVLERIHCRK